MNLCMQTVVGTHCPYFSLCCGWESNASWVPPDTTSFFHFLSTFLCFLSLSLYGHLERDYCVMTEISNTSVLSAALLPLSWSHCVVVVWGSTKSRRPITASHSGTSEQEATEKTFPLSVLQSLSGHKIRCCWGENSRTTFHFHYSHTCCCRRWKSKMEMFISQNHQVVKSYCWWLMLLLFILNVFIHSLTSIFDRLRPSCKITRLWASVYFYN